MWEPHTVWNLVRYPWVFCKCRFNVFSLSRNLTRRTHWGVMRIYGSELLVVCNHLFTFGDHRHCDSENVFNLSRDFMWPHFLRFMWIYGWKPLNLSHHLAVFGGHRTSASVDIKYFICTWPQKTTWRKDHVTWVWDPHCMSPTCQVWWR